MLKEPFLRRVHLRHYKSIAECDVELGHLTLLVGRNGAGKSNFLDAIRFVADGLRTSLDHAIKSRGGIQEVRRRSTGHPHDFEIELELALPDSQTAIYQFEVGATKKGGFRVKNESLKVSQGARRLGEFSVHEGQIVRKSEDTMPPSSADRLYLVTAAGLPQFRPVYDALLAMGFYNLNPAQMKEIQSPDAGDILRRDGSNIASVVARLAEDRAELKSRIKDYLQQIVPDVDDFERVPLGHRETLQFRQKVKGSTYPWNFYAGSMSDGTLRALGILVAAMQLADRKDPVRFVGIEEPETALHPAAVGALMESLREAAVNTQIVVTTHSPDLLDQFRPDLDSLLVVLAAEGISDVGPADPASIDAIQRHLYTAGDLLRMDQLSPAPSSHQLSLAFENPGAAREPS